MTSKLPLLVVEDSDEDFDTIQQALKKANLDAEVRRVVSGDACLALLRELDAPRPALVLMDLNTPGVDGRETLRTIKSDESFRSLPVVVLTTSAAQADLEFCYAAGANAYHVKPVRYPDHVELLIGLLKYWLEEIELPVQRRPLS